MKRYKELIIIFLFSLTPFLWLHGGQIVFGHDSGVRLNFVENLKSYLYAWDPTANFGHNWSLYTGFLVSQFPEAFFAWVFGSLSRGQPFGFWFWFFEIGLSLWVFLRYFFRDGKFLLLRIIGPILFMYNFYILNGWSIVERAKFSLYIALPLMIVIFFKTARKEWTLLKGGIVFGLLFFAFNGGGSLPLYGGMLVTFSILVVYFLRTNPVRIIGFSALCGVFFFLFNAYWILPQINLFAGSYSGAVSARGGIEGLIAWEREISKYASIQNILRLQGFPDWYDNPEHPFANFYIHNPFLIVFSYAPMAVILFGFLFLRRKIQKNDRSILLFLFILGVVGLFFTAGSHPPFGIIYVYAMRHIPGFAVFRSSFYKFAPTVYLPIIIYFGYFLSLFFNFPKRKILIGVAIACGIVLYHTPYLTGNFFALKRGFSTRVTVPSYVTDMAALLRQQTHPTDRILLVPPLDVGFINSPIDTYTWGFFSLDVLPRSIVNRSFVANDSNDDSITRLLYQSLKEGDHDTFIRIAQITGVTHVLWRGDVRLSSGQIQDLSHVELFHLVGETGMWKLYAIGLGVAVPMVYGVSDVTLVNDNSFDDAYIVGKVLSGQSPAVLRVINSDAIHQLSPKERFIEAECFLCKTNEYTKLVEAITVSAFRKIPVVTKDGSTAEIDARLSAASAVLLAGDVPTYEYHMDRAIEIVNTLSGSEKDYYANRILAYLDAHLRDTHRPEVEVLQSTITPYTWKAEGNTYRFGIDVPIDGVYTLWYPEALAYESIFTLDGKKYGLTDTLMLSQGYHRLMMMAKKFSETVVTPVFLRETMQQGNNKPPAISFSQKNPTRYEVSVTDANEPFVLILNQRYDPQWGLSVHGIRQDYYHGEANGFANSWIVPKTGSYMLTLYYIPQQQEYLGIIISAFSIVGSCIYLIVKRK